MPAAAPPSGHSVRTVVETILRLKALLAPGVGRVAVAIVFPESLAVSGTEFDAAQPFDALPGVATRDDGAQRSAVLGGQWFSVVMRCQHDIAGEKRRQRQICRVTPFAVQEDEPRVGRRL